MISSSHEARKTVTVHNSGMDDPHDIVSDNGTDSDTDEEKAPLTQQQQQPLQEAPDINISMDDADVAGSEEDDESDIVIISRPIPIVEAAAKPEHKASITSSIANLANTIMGSGILALPFAFKSSGIVLGSILLVFVAAFQNYTVCLLRRCADITKQRTYGGVAVYLFGPRFGVVVDIVVALQTFGVCVAYVVITGDLFPQILSFWIFGEGSSSAWFVSRAFIMGVFTFGVIYPLCLLKKMDSLKYTSYIAVVSIVYLTCYVVFRSVDLQLPDEPVILAKSDWSVFLTVPIISLAYTCHFNWFEIRFELKNPTKRRQFTVIHSAFLIVSSLYALVGAFGYITFYEGVHGNILINYFDNDLMIQLGRLGVTLTVIFSFPILAFSTREALLRSLFPKLYGGHGFSSSFAKIGTGPEAIVATKQHADAFWRSPNGRKRTAAILTSLFICAAAYVLALVLPDIAFVLGLVGATASTAICYVFPSLFILKLSKDMSASSLLHTDAYTESETDSDGNGDAYSDAGAQSVGISDVGAGVGQGEGDDGLEEVPRGRTHLNDGLMELNVSSTLTNEDGVNANASEKRQEQLNTVESSQISRSLKDRWCGFAWQWLYPRRRSMRVHIVPSIVVMLLGVLFGFVGTYQTLATGQSLH